MKNLLTTLFGFDPKQHNVRTEILAGVTTFLTMAYMLALVPNILGVTGMDKGALFTTVIVSIVLSVISYVLINLICGKRKNVSLATILLAIVFMLKYIM